MKNYGIALLVLSLTGASIANDTPTKEETTRLNELSQEEQVPQPQTYSQKVVQELKANAPWFLGALVSNYGTSLWDKKPQNHTLNFASAALISPFCNRFFALPGLMAAGLEIDPNRAYKINALARLAEATSSATFSKKSIRPLVYGLGTCLLTGTALRLLSQDALGEVPSQKKLFGSILAGLLIPALLVKADEWAEQPDEVAADKPQKTPQNGSTPEPESLT